MPSPSDRTPAPEYDGQPIPASDLDPNPGLCPSSRVSACALSTTTNERETSWSMLTRAT
ncbi:MAG: hypothetical protein MZV63_07170 [Marinilabiliales bacterium]|nr:hypothetical protein [Marinilabiliales bacterium]